MQPHRTHLLHAVAAVFVGLSANSPGSADPGGELFQPDTATASSEFSGSFDILQTIDGSGMPDCFGPGDAHATYVGGNHWTTRSNVIPATATFFFDTPVTLNSMVLWNHRSNGIASNSTYEVTEFDLTLFDDQGQELASFPDQVAEPDLATGQTYFWSPVDDVASVEFVITENQTLANGGTNSSFTGFAEIAFASALQPITLPGDYNDNGLVEQGDLNLVLNNWGEDAELGGVPVGWNQDRPYCLIDQGELNRVLNNWGDTTAPDFSGHSVPEPGTLALGLAGLLIARRGARR